MKKTFTTALIILFSLVSEINAQTWNFKSVSNADKALLNADTQNWKYDETNDRWDNQTAINGALIANGQELAYAQGLLFNVPSENQLRPGSKRMALNNKSVTLTIPNATAGYEVKIVWSSSSSSTTRSLAATNLTYVSGTNFGTKVDNKENTTVATVNTDGDITFSCPDGALYVYSLSIGEQGGGGGGENVTYGAGINPKKAQLSVGMANSDMAFYNIEALDNVNIKDGKVVVAPKSGTADEFSTTALRAISYAEAQESELPAGTFTNATGIQILDARGWQESAFVTFSKFDGAKTYNVYVNGTKIDGELIRDYGSYVRADALGLARGTYSMEIVAVGEDGNEITASKNSVSDITVTNYDRRGYAHFGNYGTGVGAYKDDGTLKDNAKVLYVTANTFDTVKLTLPTDNKGNTEEFTGLGLIFKALQKGYKHDPICVRFIGFIDRNKISSTQLLSDQGSLLLKGNSEATVMEVTMEGVGNDCWFNSGLGIINGTSIEIRNIGIGGHPAGKDCVEIKGTHHVWVHNMDFFYAQKGSGDQVKGDGTLDSKDLCSYATFSYNHYWDCGKANLCGMKSEQTSNLITYHHNWFDHSDSRHPRVRTSTVHVWNNYYDGVAKYGIGATSGCSVFSECNFFRNTKYPMLSSKQGRDAEGDGTFSGENGGIIKAYGNVMVERNSHFACYTQNTPGYTDNFDCYEVQTPSETIPATVVTVAGGTSYNNFDTNSATMYEHTADEAALVPSIVTGIYGAGRMQHGDISYTFNNATDDADSEWNANLWNVIANYKSGLIGIVGGETINPGGEEGGEQGGEEGGDTPTHEEGTVVCHFTGNAPSNSQVTVNGSYSNSKGSVTYNGETYNICVKMESATSITVKPQANCTVTLIFGGTTVAGGKKVKVDGTAVTLDAEGKCTIDGTAGTDITITKGDSINLFLIVIAPKE